MDEKLKNDLNKSLEEWADIEKRRALQEKKDRQIISIYCAKNDISDVYRTIELLKKHRGMPSYAKETVITFEENYPNSLTAQIICDYEDTKDIYKDYLEKGGDEDE